MESLTPEVEVPTEALTSQCGVLLSTSGVTATPKGHQATGHCTYAALRSSEFLDPTPTQGHVPYRIAYQMSTIHLVGLWITLRGAVEAMETYKNTPTDELKKSCLGMAS